MSSSRYETLFCDICKADQPHDIEANKFYSGSMQARKSWSILVCSVCGRYVYKINGNIVTAPSVEEVTAWIDETFSE